MHLYHNSIFYYYYDTTFFIRCQINITNFYINFSKSKEHIFVQ